MYVKTPQRRSTGQDYKRPVEQRCVVDNPRPPVLYLEMEAERAPERRLLAGGRPKSNRSIKFRSPAQQRRWCEARAHSILHDLSDAERRSSFPRLSK